jgi:hypothetical protein
MTYAQWRNSYTRFSFVHADIISFLNSCFTQVCLVELGRCIFSVYVQFQYCLVGSLLVH